MIYLDLLVGFLKVGLFAFGGAYGAIPLIRDVVLSYGWLTDEEITYMIAVSESTPGSIMVNLATYVGFSQGGVWGSILATLAVITPSFVIILVVMFALKKAMKNRFVKGALSGLSPCIIGIIFATGIFMMFTNILPVTGVLSFGEPNFRALIITVLLAAILYGLRAFKKNPSPIMVIVCSAVIGAVAYSF